MDMVIFSAFNGGADRSRTGDLWSAIPALSQLSYSPIGDPGEWELML